MFKKIIYDLSKWITFPIILFIVGIIFSIAYFFNFDINPNVISYNHKSNTVRNINKIVQGSFFAQENYLGIITIKFDKVSPFRGSAVFKIKNILDKDWYHTATIAAFQSYDNSPYAFGIPIIERSKNQKYQFELVPIATTSGNLGFTVSKENPVLISQYQIPRALLLSDLSVLFNFIVKKLSYYADTYTESFWKVFAVYNLPLALYVIYIMVVSRFLAHQFKKEVKKNLYHFLNSYTILFLICICIDIFIIRKYSDSTTVIFSLLWITGVIAYKLNSKHSFGLALVGLTMLPILLSADMGWIAEKASVWTYIFMTMGTLHSLLELKSLDSSKMHSFFVKLSDLFAFITIIDLFILACLKSIFQFAIFSFRNFIKITCFAMITGVITFTVMTVYKNVMLYRDRQLKNPTIELLEPTFVYSGTKVVIYGISLGRKNDPRNRLLRDGHEIKTDYWEDHKIIFTVPLEWKKGSATIWAEKPVYWNGKTYIEKTKTIEIKILPASSTFTHDDDLYYEQMKAWRKETRELNAN